MKLISSLRLLHLLIFLLLSHMSLSLADETPAAVPTVKPYCGGDDQHIVTVNLTDPGKILETQPIYDQGSAGICYAAATTLNFNAFLRRQTPNDGKDEEASVWSMALAGTQRLGNEHGVYSSLKKPKSPAMTLADAQATAAQFVPLVDYPEARPRIRKTGPGDLVTLTIPQSDVSSGIDGGSPNAVVKQIRESGHWCPTEDTAIEQTLKQSDVRVQEDLLLALGKIFDSVNDESATRDPQKIWDDLSVVAKSMWDQAYQYCHIPLAKSAGPQWYSDFNQPLGSLYMKFQVLYVGACDKFYETKKPYENFFGQKIQLEQVVKDLAAGANPDQSWEQAIASTLEQIANSSPQDRPTYEDQLIRIKESFDRLQQQKTDLELSIAELEKKLLPFSDDFTQARKAMKSFAPFLIDENLEREDNWNQMIACPNISSENFINYLQKQISESEKSSNDRLSMGLDPYVQKISGWPSFNSELDHFSGQTIPRNCIGLQIVSQLAQDQSSSPLWQACVPEDISDPFKDLIKTLGLISPTTTSEQLSSFLARLIQGKPDLDVTSFFGQMLVPGCMGQSQDLPAKPVLHNVLVASGFEGKNSISQKMMAHLDSNIPLVIDVCASFLDKPDSSNFKGICYANDYHSMSVVGYRSCGSEEKQFLVQNSWGQTWCPTNPQLECVQSKGAFWVSESVLQQHTSLFTSVLTDQELKAVQKRTSEYKH